MRKEKLLALIGSICLILVLAALPFMAACAKPAPAPPPAPAPAPAPPPVPVPPAKVYTMKVGMVGGEKACDTKALRRMEELIEERTNGQVEVELYPSSILGSAGEQLDSCCAGGLEYFNCSHLFLCRYVPWLSASVIPFTYKTCDEAAKHYADVIIPKLNEEVKERGLWIMPTCMHNGLKDLAFRMPIRSLADMKGKKMRVMSPGVPVEFAKALGAKPMVTPWGEVATSCEQGVIDGFALAMPLLWSEGLYEVVPYITVTRHLYIANLPVVSLKWWETLPNDLRDVIVQAHADATEYNNQMWAEEEITSEKNLKEAGATIIELSPEAYAEFKQASKPAIDFAKKEYGEDIVNLWLKK